MREGAISASLEKAFLSVFPRCRREEQEHWEQLKSARKHIKDKHKLGRHGQKSEILRRTYKLKSRSDIVYRCRNGGKTCYEVIVFKRNDYH